MRSCDDCILDPAAGEVHPFDDPNAGCDGKNADKLWICQAAISFTTMLLGVAVYYRNEVTLQEKEEQVLYVGANTDPPNIEIISRKARFRRARIAWLSFLFELVCTVIIHPVPGYRRRNSVKALERFSVYEFESMIGLFLFLSIPGPSSLLSSYLPPSYLPPSLPLSLSLSRARAISLCNPSSAVLTTYHFCLCPINHQ